MDIFLSIIIPCYNVGTYLNHCINSLVKQDKSISMEFIFINDGSTDQTLQLLNEFTVKDLRVVVIDKLNGGVSAARNDALKIAKGKYIYFVDGDDYLTENAVERIHQCLVDIDCDMLITNLYYAYADGLRAYSHGITPQECSVNEIFKICNIFPTPPQNIYKTSIIKEQKIFFNEELKVGEVYAFTLDFLRYSQKVKIIEDCIYYYVMRGSSATHQPNFTSDITVLNTIHQIYNSGKNFLNIPSFHLTAFKIATSFTYNKYVREGVCSEEAISTVRKLLVNDDFGYILKRVACERHSCLKERLLAIYIGTTSIIGFKLLTNISKFKQKK